MNQSFVILFLVFYSSVSISQSGECEYVHKNGNDIPKGYYFGEHITPFAPVPYFDFGVPDTSKISINIYNSIGLSVYKSDCRLPGGNYYFDCGLLHPSASGILQIRFVSDLDSYYKPAEMHFEGTKKFINVK